MKVCIAAFVSFSTKHVLFWEADFAPPSDWGYRVSEYVDVELPDLPQNVIESQRDAAKLAKLAELEKAIVAVRGAA